jgi:hypothetical protein
MPSPLPQAMPKSQSLTARHAQSQSLTARHAQSQALPTTKFTEALHVKPYVLLYMFILFIFISLFR